jgi:hypothetical protein
MVTDRDEIDAVLAALRELAHTVTSPVVKECLEAARDDIIHLAGVDAEHESEDVAA